MRWQPWEKPQPGAVNKEIHDLRNQLQLYMSATEAAYIALRNVEQTEEVEGAIDLIEEIWADDKEGPCSDET